MTEKQKKEISYQEYKTEVLQDYKIAVLSRECSLMGRREVLTGKAKFGIFGAGKELAQIAWAKAFEKATRMLFSTLTVMISVPAATKLMHWCVTLVNSTFVMELPFLFALTFVFFFVSGGVSGMHLARQGICTLYHPVQCPRRAFGGDRYVFGHYGIGQRILN